MSSTLHTVVFASLLLALPARAHARDAQPASPAHRAQQASPAHRAQQASPAHRAQQASSAHRAQQASPAHGLRSEVGASQLISFGLPTSLSIGISPFITFRWPDTSLSLEPRVFTSTALSTDEHTYLSAGLRAWMSAVSACRHLRAFSLCGMFQFGEASMAEEASTVIDNNTLIIAFGARAGAGWRVSRYLSLHAALELHAHAGRPEAWEDTEIRVWQAPWVSAITAFGVTVPVTPE